MTISIDDRHLVESYQAGDTHAFADLVEAYTPALLGHAIRRLGDRAAAEDAVQETFVRAFRALARFDGDYRVGPWLHRILINVCNDEGNRRRREAEKFDRFAADPFAAELAPGVEDELGLDFDDANLAEALQSLPSNYREALNLRFVEELPYDEVARAAGVSEQNARARVSRARSAARAALRGVAAIPVLLISTLRRTESVAVAVGHSDSVRAATDAVVASAPSATPMVTKAVIGVSVVASMVVPAGGPAVVEQSRALGSEAPAVVEVEAAAPEAVPAPEAADFPTSGASPVAGGDAAVDPEGPGAEGTSEVSATPAVGADPDPGTATGDAVPLPSTGATPGDPTGTPSAPPLVTDEPPVVLPDPTGGTVTLSGLTITAAGPRLDVVGDASVVVGDRTLSGAVTGRLSYTDQVDVRRFTVALVVTLDDGSTIDLRVQAQGRVTADEADVALVDATTFDLSGPFRATAPAAVGLIESGPATGVLDLAAGTFTLTLG